MQFNFKGLLQRAGPVALVATVAGGMLATQPSSKIAIWLIGSGLAGLLFALRLHLIRGPESEAWKEFVADSKKAQKQLSDSPYGIYRKIIFGGSIPDNSFEHIGLEDTITNFIFIVACFGVGAALWLEPSVIDFQAARSTEAFGVAKASLFNLITVALLAAGFSGVFLNVFTGLRRLR